MNARPTDADVVAALRVLIAFCATPAVPVVTLDDQELVAIRATGYGKALRRAHSRGEVALYRPAKSLLVRRGDLTAWLETTKVERVAQMPPHTPADTVDIAINRALNTGRLRRVVGA